MASIRAGMMSFDCGCTDYEKEQWGCEKPTEQPIWSDDVDDFYNCPFRFIASCTFDFIERYDAIKTGMCTGLPYDKTINRFLVAVKIYENYFNRFYDEKNKQPQRTSSSKTE
jgi:hypothetical protein